MGLIDRFFDKTIDRLVKEQLSILETENNFLIGTRSGTQSDRDRFTYDRSEILEQSLLAWRTNPLARRIVELTSLMVDGYMVQTSALIQPITLHFSAIPALATTSCSCLKSATYPPL